MRELNENEGWTIVLSCLFICVAAWFISIVVCATIESTQKNKLLLENNYEQVMEPGSSSPVWKKIK